MTTPDAITRYFAASAAGDIDAIVACFASDAHVVDQDERFTGQAEIRAWREALATTFAYTTEVTSVEQSGDEFVVGTHLVGDFPGGEVDLTNRFTVTDGVITRLLI
jgi:ketosteroid isomerase-like protein